MPSRSRARTSQPPPHWRLEAIAATERPRSLTLERRRPHAVFIQDRDTSDVWLLDLDGRGPPQRLTTGREPMPYWEDTSRGSRRTARRSPTPTRATSGSCRPRAARRAGSLEAGSPVWLDDDRLVVAVERERRDAAWPCVDVADPWPRRLAVAHGELERTATSGGPPSRPTAREVAFAFTPRADLNRTRDPRRRRRDRRRPGADRHAAASHDREPGLVARRRDASRSSPSAPAGTSCTSSAPTARRPSAHARASADFARARVAPRRRRGSSPSRGRRNRFDLVTRRRRDRRGRPWSPRAAPGARRTGPPTAAIVATYEDHATPPQLRLVRDGVDARDAARADAARRPRGAARRARGRHVQRRSTALEIPAFLFRPRGASPDAPGARGRLPARRPDRRFYGDEWDGHAQYFVDKGYAWLAINFRGSTGYGRDFERAEPRRLGRRRHEGLPRGRRLPPRARLGRRRPPGDLRRELRLLPGAARRSTDDPEHRFRCAVCKYGDCDILTSWAQGDREGVQDLERMMGPPVGRAARPTAPARPSTGSRTFRRPLLIAHGELDERVQPEAVRAARRRAAPARQDLRVRHLPDRGARPPARRAAAPLLPPARALPRLVPDVSAGQCLTRRGRDNRDTCAHREEGTRCGSQQEDPRRRWPRSSPRSPLAAVAAGAGGGRRQGRLHRRAHATTSTASTRSSGVEVPDYEVWNLQYATLTDKAANDFAHHPRPRRVVGELERRQDVHLHAARRA